MKKIYWIALAFAVLTGVAVYVFAGQLSRSPVAGTTAVVVAKQEIAKGTVITLEMVKISNLPSSAVNPQAVHTLSSAVGKVAAVTIEPEEQILTAKLNDKNVGGSGLSYSIPEGKRAITIAVSDITGVAGYLKAGDHVDVIASYKFDADIKSGDQSKSKNIGVTTLMAQNIEVLAVGSTSTSEDNKTYANVTVAVSPEESLKISNAQNYGSLALTLRSHSETTEPTVDPYSPSMDMDLVDWMQNWAKEHQLLF